MVLSSELIESGTQQHLGAGSSRATLVAGLNVLVASGVSEVAMTELDIPGAAAADYTAVNPSPSIEALHRLTTIGCGRVS